MAPSLHVVRTGTGPRIVFVHGSATDHTAWSIQLGSTLRERFSLVAYDRQQTPTVEDAASELATVIGEGRVLVVGSSFGAVVTLELLRSRPELCAGAVLIEPPMAPSDEIAAAPSAFFTEFDRLIAEQGGPAAGKFFLRTVLGETAFDLIPRAFQERSAAKWREIRADCVALLAYKPRYWQLSALATPVLLLGGERSAGLFGPTLAALSARLPAARRETVAGAGHMLHVEVSRTFNAHLARFADEIGLTSASC